MIEEADESDFESGVPGDAKHDPDTRFILDYLEDKLEPEEADKLENRARTDRAFRHKLADVVLLKGLVMLAVEKRPGRASRKCRATQKMFRAYVKGETNAVKTAELSRHIEECFECELAFEHFESQVSMSTAGQGCWRRILAAASAWWRSR